MSVGYLLHVGLMVCVIERERDRERVEDLLDVDLMFLSHLLHNDMMVCPRST